MKRTSTSLFWEPAGCSRTDSFSRWAGLRYAIEDEFVYKGLRSVVMQESVQQHERWSSHWPVRSDQIVVKTRDGRSLGGDAESPGSWRQVHSLAEVDNMYDIGLWRNLRDAMNLRV